MTKVDFTYPPNVGFSCNRCGLCCGDTEEKTRHILLLQSEVNGISAETSLLIEDFAEQIADRAPYLYEMKKPGKGKCFFLKDNHCSIYSQRPLICRFYPFELKFVADKETHVFSFTLECLGIGKGKTMTKADFEELFLLAQARLR